MKHNFFETIIAVLLVVVALLLLNPFHFWMPDMMVVGTLIALLVLCGVFAAFVVREGGGDERDLVHRSLAGRSAYLAGAAVLIVGIVIRGYQHNTDPWLILALLAMVVAKIGTRFWSDTHR